MSFAKGRRIGYCGILVRPVRGGSAGAPIAREHVVNAGSHWSDQATATTCRDGPSAMGRTIIRWGS